MSDIQNPLLKTLIDHAPTDIDAESYAFQLGAIPKKTGGIQTADLKVAIITCLLEQAKGQNIEFLSDKSAYIRVLGEKDENLVRLHDSETKLFLSLYAEKLNVSAVIAQSVTMKNGLFAQLLTATPSF